ncbi:MAG: asparagine synthase (glutamine-hydrolyzing) [Alphaproteobacteria bacterium]
MSADEVAEARRAVATLAHRGPDSEGEWCEGGVYMGHRRLSIIDLSEEARQPFADASGRYVLSYNGELYNYLELRRELESLGARFRTESDTEVMLEAFIRWGEAALDRFDGMFAAAFHDRRLGRHFLVRDPLGQKPLYYHQFHNGIIYASELRALMAVPSFRWRLDREAFYRYLAHGYYALEETPLVGVHKLRPGEWLAVSPSGVTRGRYWHSVPGGEVRQGITDAEALDEFEHLFADSCARALRSDVPFGAFLSGGIDSSLVLAYCHRVNPDLRSFSVAMAEADFDESAKADMVRRHLGITDHHVFVMDGRSVVEAMDDVLANQDEPHADPGFVNVHFLAKSCRPHLTVALAGDGGDELFGGYATFAGLRGEPWCDALPRPLLTGIRSALRHLPGGDRYLGLHFKLTAYLQGFPATPATRFPLWLATDDPDTLAHLCPASAPGFFSRFGESGSLYGPIEELMAPVGQASPQQRLLHYYQQVFLPEFICAHTDRAAMRFGLEVRSPFLSPALVAFANRLPDHMRVRGGSLKWLLKQAALRCGLPTPIARQRKQGFTFPLARWLKSALRDHMEHLLDPAVWDDGLVDPAVVTRLRDEHIDGRRNNYRLLYALMVFRAWRQRTPDVEVPR